MSLRELLDKVDHQQAEIESFGKLSSETLNKIHYRFRLDWNFHSNAMEGNSLTQQETRSVMINNVTVEGKPLKDVLEIKGHDETISHILRIGRGDLRLSEKRIQEIHKAIIHEDDPQQAQKIGKWKSENNHLINYKGEKYEFTPYQQVPDEMHKLLNWLNTNYDLIKSKKEKAIHPALLAFNFHITYVSIHPFFDGNGRTARILTNLILIALGYPPVIIKVEDKNAYNQYLADIQGYGGSTDLFLEFMCKQLLRSQDIVLKATQGISIEDPDDLDKKISLLEKELDAIDSDDEVKERFGPETFLRMYSGWISDLLKKAIPVVQKFNKFFTGTNHHLYISNGVGNISFVDESAENIILKLFTQCQQNKKEINSFNNFHLNLSAHYGTLVKGGIKTFGCNYSFQINFELIKYWVEVDVFTEKNGPENRLKFPERLLHKPFPPSEIDNLVKILGESIYTHIDVNTRNKGLR